MQFLFNILWDPREIRQVATDVKVLTIAIVSEKRSSIELTLLRTDARDKKVCSYYSLPRRVRKIGHWPNDTLVHMYKARANAGNQSVNCDRVKSELIFRIWSVNQLSRIGERFQKRHLYLSVLRCVTFIFMRGREYPFSIIYSKYIIIYYFHKNISQCEFYIIICYFHKNISQYVYRSVCVIFEVFNIYVLLEDKFIRTCSSTY